MLKILPVESVRIAKNRGCFLKRDSMLFIVLQGLAGIPREHIIVYTLIALDCPSTYVGKEC
jgi:hypothetical protein